MININKQLGTTIRQFRLALGFSTETLAEEIGITTSRLAKIEEGSQEIDVRTLQSCANALDMQLSELIQAADEGAEPIVIEVKEDKQAAGSARKSA
jgi:Helix-turn-helix.